MLAEYPAGGLLPNELLHPAETPLSNRVPLQHCICSEPLCEFVEEARRHATKKGCAGYNSSSNVLFKTSEELSKRETAGESRVGKYEEVYLVRDLQPPVVHSSNTI